MKHCVVLGRATRCAAPSNAIIAERRVKYPPVLRERSVSQSAGADEKC